MLFLNIPLKLIVNPIPNFTTPRRSYVLVVSAVHKTSNSQITQYSGEYQTLGQNVIGVTISHLPPQERYWHRFNILMTKLI